MSLAANHEYAGKSTVSTGTFKQIWNEKVADVILAVPLCKIEGIHLSIAMLAREATLASQR